MTSLPTASKVLLLAEGRTDTGADRPMRVRRFRLARLAPFMNIAAGATPDRRRV